MDEGESLINCPCEHCCTWRAAYRLMVTASIALEIKGISSDDYFDKVDDQLPEEVVLLADELISFARSFDGYDELTSQIKAKLYDGEDEKS